MLKYILYDYKKQLLLLLCISPFEEYFLINISASHKIRCRLSTTPQKNVDAAIVIWSFSPYCMYLFFSQDNESSIYCWRCNNSNTTHNCEFYSFLTSFKSSNCIHNASVFLVADTASLGTPFPTFLVKRIGRILQGRKVKVKWRWFFGPLKMKGLRCLEMWGTKHLFQQCHAQRSWQHFFSRCDIKRFIPKKFT